MTRVAGTLADEVVLNLVPPAHVRAVRAAIDAAAAAAGQSPPRLAVWVPVALDPGAAALAQMAGQIAIYLAPPGYGELFAGLGFGELVQRARAGERRSELARAIPIELLQEVGALGDARGHSGPDRAPTTRPARTPSRSCLRRRRIRAGAACSGRSAGRSGCGGARVAVWRG